MKSDRVCPRICGEVFYRPEAVWFVTRDGYICELKYMVNFRHVLKIT
jgi:hypothetical protein